jgi:hypothetical protein
MRNISVTMSTSLDGVVQGPGRPDEDTRGGFDRGGWAVPYNDEVMAEKMGSGMASGGAMLFGRRTCLDFAGYWPHQTANLAVVGSAALVRSLFQAGLIDQFTLLIHPLVLGKGRTMFDQSGSSDDFELIDSVATSTGVLIATYRSRSAQAADSSVPSR